MALALGTAAWSGGLGLPHNDDWAYIRAAETLAETGQLKLSGWNQMALLGQTIPAAGVLATIGGGILTLQILNLLTAALLLWLCYRLMALFLEPRHAILAVSPLLLVPDLWMMSTSFMTEVPALALAMACLLLGCLAIRESRGTKALALFSAALGLGLWAVTIREHAFAAPAAVLVATFIQWRGQTRARAVYIGGAVLVVGFVLFEVWRRGMEGGDSVNLRLAPREVVKSVVQLLYSAGLALSPVTLGIVARWRDPLTWACVAVTGGAAAAMALLGVDSSQFFAGNYLNPIGAYDGARLAAVGAVIPGWLWFATCAVAALSAGVLIRWALGGVRTGLGLLSGLKDDKALLAVVLFAALTVVGVLLLVFVAYGSFLRYYLAAGPVLALLMLRSQATQTAGKRLRPWAIVPVAVALAATLGISVGTLRADAVRWEAAEELVIEGAEPMDIAVGLAWSGYHSAGPAIARNGVRDQDVAWWTGMFSDARECFVITQAPLEAPSRFDLIESTEGLNIYRSRRTC